jgi:pyruvate dehydrogenase E1 component
MYQEQENIFYYITLQNEDYVMPPKPEGVDDGVLKGMYLYQKASKPNKGKHVQLFGGGSIMLQVLAARDLLAERFGITADVWGVTSYQELRREALRCERHNRLHPTEKEQVPYVTQMLSGTEGPIIAASDYMTLVQDQIAPWVPRRYVALGTDGYGMSDTREALRRHFEVDAECIAVGVLHALRKEGTLGAEEVAKAIKSLGVDPNKPYSFDT